MLNYPNSTLCEYRRLVPISCELRTEPSVSTIMWRILGLVDKLLKSRQRLYCGLLVGCLRILILFSYVTATALSILRFRVIQWRIHISWNCIKKLIHNYFKALSLCVCVCKIKKITHNYGFTIFFFFGRESKSFPPFQWHDHPKLCIERNLSLTKVTATSTDL